MNADKSAVLISGGARRVGAALAVYFARAGYDIALHYNSSGAEAESVCQKVRALAVNCELFEQDLREFSSFPALLSKVYQAFPNLRILINNASIFERAEFMQTDEEIFDRQFAVNLKAPFFLTKAFAELMLKNRVKASVVNILDSDIAATQISHFAYLMSKKSLADFTEMAARALGSEIIVNAVAPSIMLPSYDHDAAYMEKLSALLPLGANPDLESLCEAVRWSATQRHITGQIIYVDSGKHLI